MSLAASDYTRALLEAMDRDEDSLVEHDSQIIAFTLEQLPALIEKFGIAKPFVVVDSPALHASKLNGVLLSLLDGLNPVYFDQFAPNPTSDDVANAATIASASACDGVVAIGGGSCCDVAKGAALACTSPDRIYELTRGVDMDSASPAPMIAVPTTAGTGSETTHFAAIYVDGMKISIAHPDLRPVGVILDQRFHLTMPGAVAACSGLDALCQAMESTWAVGSTDESLAYARAGAALIAKHLTPSVLDATPLARRSMLVGAHLAGKAINISKTTAAHALSYQITKSCGLAHGHAVALTIGEIANWNAKVTPEDNADPRGTQWVEDRVREACAYLGIEPEDCSRAFREMLTRFGLEASLQELDIPDSMLEIFAASVDPIRVSNNPRMLDASSTLGCLQRSAEQVHAI